MTIHVTVDASQINALVRELEAPSAFLRDIGRAVKTLTERRFATKTSPTGATWSPWSPSYARTRTGLDSLLIDWSTHKSGTPHLASSFQVEYSRHSVEVGTDVDYADTHQYGRGKIKARPFLGLSAQDQPTIDDAISDAFFEMQARAMGARS